jgi:hypothetical protein
MRKKRKIFYEVYPTDNWWWIHQLRQWADLGDRAGNGASGQKTCRTLKMAVRIAMRVPSGQVTITKYRRKGEKYVYRDYYLRNRD